MQQHTKNRNSERTQSPAALGRKSLLACALMSLLASGNTWAEVLIGGENPTSPAPINNTISVDGDGNGNSVILDGDSGTLRAEDAAGYTTIKGNSIEIYDNATNATAIINSDFINNNSAQHSRTQSSINYLDQRINHLDRRIDDVAERAYGGIASVAALAAIPAPAAGKTFSVGVGAGNYSSENALAVGFRAALTESVSVSAGLSRNTASKTVSNMGVGYSW